MWLRTSVNTSMNSSANPWLSFCFPRFSFGFPLVFLGFPSSFMFFNYCSFAFPLLFVAFPLQTPEGLHAQIRVDIRRYAQDRADTCYMRRYAYRYAQIRASNIQYGHTSCAIVRLTRTWTRQKMTVHAKNGLQSLQGFCTLPL